MSVANGFPQIHGFFYSVFDQEQGSKVVIQVPEGCVLKTDDPQVPEPFIDFDSVKNYIIPKPPICNALVSVCFNEYKIIGYPVHLVNQMYQRNTFTFNFAFIFKAESDSAPYESVILRTAKLFKAIEEQNRFLSDKSQFIALKSAMEQMFQDLNTFSECQIPLNEANKIDIKLFPILEAPPQIKGSHVPVSTVKLQSLIDEAWDPTLEKLVPFINGTNSVRRIADLASADYELTKKGIQHLVHYDCVTVINIFQFSNFYAITPAIKDICDLKVFNEFNAFVYKRKEVDPPTNGSSQNKPPQGPHNRLRLKKEHRLSDFNVNSISNSIPNSNSNFNNGPNVLSMKQIFKLYSAFNNGMNLKNWVLTHQPALRDLDLNRFLTFGVLKGLIYAVNCYPIWPKKLAKPSQEFVEKALKKLGLKVEDSIWIMKCVDRPTNLVDLCTELRANQQTVCELLKEIGEWTYIYK